MLTPKFTHLHVHDQYSLLDSIGTSEEYCKKAKELGYKSLAITNHGNINSFIQFQNAATKYGIKPIFGCEIYIVENIEERPKKEKRGHLCLWVKNQIGFNNLLKILSFSNLYGFYRRPRCSFEKLLEHLDGLIVGTACTSSFVNLENGEKLLEKIKQITDDVFLEIMPHNYDFQKKHNARCLELSKKYGIPLLLTYDCHYIEKEMAKAQEVLLCMQSDDKLSNPNRWKFEIDDLFLCDVNYILNKLKEQDVIGEQDYIQAIKNTSVVVNKCNFVIKKKKIYLPIPPQYEGLDEEKVFRDLCLSGLKRRFPNSDIPANYLERFETEYEVIKGKRFIRYFLIVYDILNWCRENGIMYGPRGSAAGCLISYALQIIEIDPIENNLIFERFLNKSRNSPPDIDLDIDRVKRHLVIERLKNVYGKEKTCNVSTFLKMEARGIIKDVSRVYEIPLSRANAFTKIIDTTIEDAIENTEEGKQFYADYKECVDMAKSLQSQVKSLSKHAGGIVISPIDIEDGIAHLIERDGTILVNWGKDDVEYAGLIKFDFLGLAMTSVLSETLNLIEKNYNEKINLYKINLNDKRIYKELNAGNTVGFFQANTYILSHLIKEIQVENINHLSDALAGCRPGPLETVTQEYIKNKKSGNILSINPVFDDITKDTYGVCIYQEQIMFILNRLAGFSMAECDEIRRVIGKKRLKEEFAPFRKAFIEGARKVGLFTDIQAEVWWENLLHYSRYGFNRSHSLSYAYICYFSGWLKTYYPYEYLAASLTYGNESKSNLLKEAQRLNLVIVPPKINTSDVQNWVVKEKRLYVPFKECKGIGPKAIETIEKYKNSNKSGFFTDDKPVIKGKLKTILDDIGAFDESLPDSIDDYFDIGVSLNPEFKYKKLFKLFKDARNYKINDLLSGDVINEYLGREIQSKISPTKGLISCSECGLRSKCEKPEMTKLGNYNILIVNEYPNWKDVENNNYLFKELNKYGFQGDDFFITNLVKCSGSKPGHKEGQICGKKWLRQEIENIKPFIVLTLGAKNVKFFTGDDQGVVRRSGTCEWNEEYGCFIFYSISPSLALWKPEDFKKLFKESIKKFADKVIDLGGFK